MGEKIRARYESYEESFLSETYHSPNFALGFSPDPKPQRLYLGVTSFSVCCYPWIPRKKKTTTAIRINFRAPIDWPPVIRGKSKIKLAPKWCVFHPFFFGQKTAKKLTRSANGNTSQHPKNDVICGSPLWKTNSQNQSEDSEEKTSEQTFRKEKIQVRTRRL